MPSIRMKNQLPERRKTAPEPFPSFVNGNIPNHISSPPEMKVNIFNGAGINSVLVDLLVYVMQHPNREIKAHPNNENHSECKQYTF